MTIGQRLAAARQHANLTQNTVAAELHVARQTISSWETERTYPDMMSIVALAKLYRLSLMI
jgi:DNA-binding XRE family transcriptional regulator